MMNVNEMIDLLGGTKKVARLMGLSAPSVSQWRSRALIPEGQLVKLAARLEIASGGAVTRRELFPDDWERIWPELARSPRSRRTVTLH